MDASPVPTATATQAAPAQPAASASEPTTQSAAHAAVASGNTGAYRDAKRAERAGKPLPAAPVAPATTPAAPAQPAAVADDPKPSRREREQADTNERIRRAIDAGVQAELDRRGVARPDAPKPTAEAAAPAWRRIAALPNAPKLTDVDAQGAPLYASVEEHSAAMAMFVNEQVATERAARTEGEQLAAADADAITSFDQRVTDLAKTDPEIVSKIAPLAAELGKKGGPYGIVSKVALRSEVGPQLLRHFAEHPEVLQRLTTLPDRFRGLPLKAAVAQHVQYIVKEIGRLEGTLETPSAPVAAPPQPKTISDAPRPADTLGSRPSEGADPRATAIKRGDTRAYREIRRQERLAATRR